MQKFSAETYFRLGEIIAFALRDTGDFTQEATDQEAKGWHEGTADMVASLCERIGLTTSRRCAEEIKLDTAPEKKITVNIFRSYLSQLHRTIGWEMEENFFLHLEPSTVAYYEQKEPLFGKEVADKFPRLTEDIAEAGKSLAVARYTAAVFHLMRIMELTVQMFGKKLGVTLVGEKVWQVILDQINVAIKNMPAKTSAQKKKQADFAAAAAHLFNVKLAWRNPVMHPKKTYTADEAMEVFGHVKAWTRSVMVIL
jgi:hypothetical protein